MTEPVEAAPVLDERGSVADALAELAPSTFRAPDNPEWLNLRAALTELERATPGMLQAEARHGFVFGHDGTTGPGTPVAAVACNAPTCPRRGQHVQVHDDTVLPVHCGGCAAILHCDHQPEVTRQRVGTIGDAYEHTITACALCGTETAARAVKPLGNLLHEAPVALLDQQL